MEDVGKKLLLLFDRVWNNNLNKKNDWKGSWPEWRSHESKFISSWFDWRRKEEGAENLWRIHDKLYDLKDWASKHPGGVSWITTTKGTDITEAFECHHLSGQAETILPKYYVKSVQTPRNSPFTFHDDGFYRTLKREVKIHLDKQNGRSEGLRSKIISDSLLLLTLSLAVAAGKFNSYILCVLSGITMCLLTVAAHNYFHQKDNFRMYYFNLSWLSFRDWRISHAMSHHLYPNTRYDLEITKFQPFFQWLPKDDKTYFSRYISWVYSPIAYSLIFYAQGIERLIVNPDGLNELIPLVYPVIMMILGGTSALNALIMWQIITVTGSFTFGLIGVNAAHHHPDIFHDGDHPRSDTLDWGIYQLDAVRDRLEIKGSLPLILVTFGDHSLHHLFPTLDHADLDLLHPILIDVCKRFGYDFTFSSQIELFKGQFQQLARTQPKINYKLLSPLKASEKS